MNKPLTRQAVAETIERTLASLPLPDCRTCDCFQGFIVQLELDATEEIEDLVAPHRIERSEMHTCMGCEPCPPATAFAAYLRSRKPKCRCCRN